MGLVQTLASKHSKQLRVVSLLVDAAFALSRGSKKLAAMLVEQLSSHTAHTDLGTSLRSSSDFTSGGSNRPV